MPAITTAILAATAVAGTAFSIFGAKKQYEGAQAQASAQEGIISDEQKAEAVRQQAMQVDARRRKLEDVRQLQRTRALSTAIAFGQGAGFGSGLQGAFGQASGQYNTNERNINNQLEFGRDLFNINADESQYKIAYAKAGGTVSTGQGFSSLGSSIMNSGQALSRIGGSVFGGSSGGQIGYFNNGGGFAPTWSNA